MIQLSKWRGRTVLGILVAVFVFSSCEDPFLFPSSTDEDMSRMEPRNCLSFPPENNTSLPRDMDFVPCLSPPLPEDMGGDMDTGMIPDFGPCLSMLPPDMDSDMKDEDMGEDTDMDMSQRSPTRRDLLEKFRDRLPGDVLAALSDASDTDA